jgi:peptidoglycan/xylan/chitin deacetylase (PgdA/CDA1 family)
MKQAIVLMYHALYDSEDQLNALTSDERPYAVRLDVFERQLQALRDRGVTLLSPMALGDQASAPPRSVVITFDDGQVSNFTLALPALQRARAQAAFFVTTDFVGRPGYLSWQQVRALAEAGMTVGSHGHTHRFLDDLSDSDLRFELKRSGELLADATGRPTTTLSFPGGRFDARTLTIARELGYEWFYTSEIGRVRMHALPADKLIPRIAVRRSLPLPAFEALATAQPFVLLRAQLSQRGKRMIRGLMGNRTYHALYSRLAK